MIALSLPQYDRVFEKEDPTWEEKKIAASRGKYS